MKLGEVKTEIPVIGFVLENLQYKNTSILTWDVGGRDKIRPIYLHYLPGVQGVIFVLDSSDRERIADASKELLKIVKEDYLHDSVFLILANKQDLPSSMSISEIVEKLELNSVLRDKKWFVQSTVATTGDGIHQGLDWLTKSIKKKEWKKVTDAN